MRRYDILTAFELEINKLDDAINKPVTDDSIYWLNQAILKFIKERFNGNAPHYTSYETTEKRTRDLINLIKSDTPDLSGPADGTGYSVYSTYWPSDLMYILEERVTIAKDDKSKMVSVFECTNDSFMYRIMNSLTDFHYKHGYARPLRVRTGVDKVYEDPEDSNSEYTLNQFVDLYTDGKYTLSNYNIMYIRYPNLIDNTVSSTEPDYTDFSEDVWMEIIKIAA